MAMVTPQTLQMSRFSHSHNGSTAVTTPGNFISEPKITASVSASPQKASPNIILKRVSNHNRNYVGKHSQLLHDTTPRFGNKQNKAVRMHSQDYSSNPGTHMTAASVGRNTPDPQAAAHSVSPIKTRKRMTINSTDAEYVKSGVGQIQHKNERAGYDEPSQHFEEGIGHRKESINSHIAYAGSKNLLTKQKRVSFRHGPLKGIRIGEKVLINEKQPITPSQQLIDDFSLSGESLIPQHHNPRGSVNPPSTAPIQPNRSTISTQEITSNDDTFLNHSPETEHPALKEILRYSKEQQQITSNMFGDVSPPLICGMDNGLSPPQSPTARSSFSHQQMQYILNQHKTRGALSHTRLHQQDVEVPSTLENTKDYFPSPPRFHRSQIPKSAIRKSHNYSNGNQLNNSSVITSYLQSPIGKNEVFKQNNGGLGANTVPIVQSHNSKVTAQQCISMNPHPKEPSDISSFFLPYSSNTIVKSQKRQEALIRGAHRSSLFTIADVPHSLTAMERSLITASQNCLHSNSDMNLTLNEGIEHHSVGQTYSTFMDISRIRYLGMSDIELKKAKSEVVSRHKSVCPFHKKMIWLSLGQPLKQTLNGLRKMKNKNPNCNHNNNSMLYQPLLSANKLEEILRHKEDALKNLYFATSLPENRAKKLSPYGNNDFRLELSPLKVGGGCLLDEFDPPKTQRNSTTPISKEILRGSTSSPDIHHSTHSNQQSRLPSLPKGEAIPKQIQELQKATGRHKHFIYALLRVNKIVRENFLKIMSDSRNMLNYRNDSCIFCYAVLPISMLFFNGLISTHSISASSGNYTPSVVPISKLMATATTQAALNSAALAQSPEVAASAATNSANFERNIGIVKFLGTIFQKVIQPPSKSPQKTASSQPPSTQKKKPEGKDFSSFRRPKLDLKDKRAILKGGDKEKLQEYRELIFRDYLKKINDTNGLIVAPPTGVFLPYKCYIGRGNNSILVRMAFKSRWWWSVVEHQEWENYNFTWTQWKSQRMMSTLKKHNEVVNELSNPNSSLLTTASSSSTCGISTIVSNQGSTLKLLEENSSTQNLHNNESGSTSPTPRVKLGDDRSSQRRLSSSLTAKKRGLNSGMLSSGGKSGMRAASSQKEESARKSDSLKKKREITKDGNLREIPHTLHTCNHIEAHYHLSNKKALFLNMRLYYEALNEDMFQFMPVTFHLTEGTESKEWDKFQECYITLQNQIEQGQPHTKEESKEEEPPEEEINPDLDPASNKKSYPEKEALMKQRRKKQRNLWIVKPGQNTNRGFGIIVARDLQHIKELVSHVNLTNGNKRTYIVQKYIDRPLLFHRRKFDIRCYAMITSTNGNVRGYFYQDGYLRTACKDFSVKNINNRFIHLTNDAIQKRHQDYGKFESGNKLSYNDFQRYMDNYHPEMKLNMQKEVVGQIKRIVTDTVKATYKKIDPNRRHQSFEIFGYDFMIDEDKKVLLIEVNTNPCLELSCPLLARLIPQMIENAMRLAVDPLFPPPHPWPNSKKNHIPDFQSENKFELVFNEATDAAELNNMPFHNAPIGDIIEEEEDENDSSSSEEDSDEV